MTSLSFVHGDGIFRRWRHRWMRAALATFVRRESPVVLEYRGAGEGSSELEPDASPAPEVPKGVTVVVAASRWSPRTGGVVAELAAGFCVW